MHLKPQIQETAKKGVHVMKRKSLLPHRWSRMGFFSVTLHDFHRNVQSGRVFAFCLLFPVCLPLPVHVCLSSVWLAEQLVADSSLSSQHFISPGLLTTHRQFISVLPHDNLLASEFETHLKGELRCF